MNCQNCRSWVFGKCIVQNAAMGKENLCNAWELSLSWEQVAETQPATDRTAELQERIAELKAFIDQLVDTGDQLESQTYGAWRQYKMLDFPAAETWRELVAEWNKSDL